MNSRHDDWDPCLTLILDTTTSVPTTLRVTTYMATNAANMLEPHQSSRNIWNTFVRGIRSDTMEKSTKLANNFSFFLKAVV
ncbi:hypothetical protein E2C01_021551 [Portunus trituberculatus]|uniref:Uncharacterized protein n=1 Tax=Portunus trituberculatus TaxID=210409 RepID=A0A5B7E4J9_PORTR|nr:hypothetical protein [Portunus trituberculatus]